MMPKYQAVIYPDAATNPTIAQADPDRKNIAVCFSGGGSRALSCAWGQMIGLRTVLGENDTPLLDQVRYISSVSGGTWASALYTFRPETISDDDFLGTSYSPSNLYYDQDHPNGLNVSKMGASALGKVPQNFANLTDLDLNKNVIAEFVSLTLLKGIPLSDSARWLWMYIVGKNVLADFGLYSFSNSILKPNETPWDYSDAKYFSLSESYATKTIFSAKNPPPKTDFIYARTNNGKPACPMLIMNTNVIGKSPPGINMSNPIQIPVQVSPVAAGIYGANPCTQDSIGGGSVESFAFTSKLNSSAAGQVSADFNRAYSLVDITACSSAFYAADLADPLQTIVAALQEKSDDDLHGWFSKILQAGEKFILNDLRSKLNSQNTSTIHGIADLVPQYNYWPVGSATEGASANRNTVFTDGGDLENTGICGLLAQTQGTVGNIISFVNGAEVLKMENGQIIAGIQVAPLFGMAYDENPASFKPYLPNGVNPFTGDTDPKGFLQIFDNRNGEFDALRTGLYLANGREAKTGPAFFQKTLTIIKNTLYGINTKRSVNLLWVQNAVVKNWQQKINDPTLQEKISAGQKKGGRVEFADFPYYNTGTKICATAAETNTLAQMWAWCTSDPESPLSVAIAQMFATAGG